MADPHHRPRRRRLVEISQVPLPRSTIRSRRETMPYIDITREFRQAVQEKQRDIPEGKRRKLDHKRSPSSAQDGTGVAGKEYINEAYTVVRPFFTVYVDPETHDLNLGTFFFFQLNHINTLTRMLTSVRKAYLNVDSRISPLSRQGSRTLDFSEGEAAWSNIRHLTNEERDQIDLQARVILQRCSTRVKEMEALEKRAYLPFDCLYLRVVLIASRFAHNLNRQLHQTLILHLSLIIGILQAAQNLLRARSILCSDSYRHDFEKMNRPFLPAFSPRTGPALPGTSVGGSRRPVNCRRTCRRNASNGNSSEQSHWQPVPLGKPIPYWNLLASPHPHP